MVVVIWLPVVTGTTRRGINMNDFQPCSHSCANGNGSCRDVVIHKLHDMLLPLRQVWLLVRNFKWFRLQLQQISILDFFLHTLHGIWSINVWCWNISLFGFLLWSNNDVKMIFRECRIYHNYNFEISSLLQSKDISLYHKSLPKYPHFFAENFPSAVYQASCHRGVSIHTHHLSRTIATN